MLNLDEQQEKKMMNAITYSLETGETKSIFCKKVFGEAYINNAFKGKSDGSYSRLR